MLVGKIKHCLTYLLSCSILMVVSDFATQSKLRLTKRQLSLLRAGDQRMIEWWYKQFRPILNNYLVAKLPEEAVADVVQETFISAVKQLPLFQARSSMMTWLLAIARHEVADYYRKKYALKAVQTVPLLEKILETELSDGSELARAFDQVFQKLSPKYQRVLLAKYDQKQSVQAIANEWKTTPKAIESLLTRARTSFKHHWAVAAA